MRTDKRTTKKRNKREKLIGFDCFLGESITADSKDNLYIAGKPATATEALNWLAENWEELHDKHDCTDANLDNVPRFARILARVIQSVKPVAIDVQVTVKPCACALN
jgi:hypothetical protein